ncbi:hypothetical protein, conserved [Trypanosoma brucei gambiense DAL972]|uniref:Uncharacterized protein n=1 Tax=Trypanosoma brucei gambiense (strain MHOM/CI/86/DAL972) TaxID=679716 RepID=D0A452_TRYB9|nr:hypothetical protein, conserved [Trypanosoma brucei gambiense DAL972]CBH16046.1 hypothetical protein, conserved [Trypanosoma brucei gambiense DAL972]|eukprot:XP_011778310.1 hypothetical protein, conserved [Trypanosoma brucei gambiense DAL972]
MKSLEDLNGCDILNRVEKALRLCEQQRACQQHMLQLLTTVEQTLEATKSDLPRTPKLTVPQNTPLTSRYSQQCIGKINSSDDSAQQFHSKAEVTSSLRNVVYVLDQLNYRATAALLDLSARVSCIDKRVQHLTNISKRNVTAINERTERIKQEAAVGATSLAVMATVVRLGCSESEMEFACHREEQNEVGSVAMRPEPTCSSAIRTAWKSLEEAEASAIMSSAEAHEAVANTTCGLLRASLMEEFKAQRYFPSKRVWQRRRDGQAEWSRKLREAAAQRKVTACAKWQRHEKAVDEAMDGEFIGEL